MTLLEKYPENIPWDFNIEKNKSKSIQRKLSNAKIVYTFTRSRINENYIYKKMKV